MQQRPPQVDDQRGFAVGLIRVRVIGAIRGRLVGHNTPLYLVFPMLTTPASLMRDTACSHR